MSLRRKSCTSCFKGRRKCDLGYPACNRCLKNQKDCSYVRSPVLQPTGNTFSLASSENNRLPLLQEQPWQDEHEDWHNFNWMQSDQIEGFLSFSIPSFLGGLGELQPVSGNNKSWEWVIEQMKDCPRAFAQSSTTTFIHEESYLDHLPPAIRAAFGICSAHVISTAANRSMLFRSMEGHANELFQSAQSGTLLEALSRLQALVLYQIVRMYHGDLKQRILAEQQESTMAAYGLQLLRRADIELQGEQITREDWVLMESIRRTVMTAFILYAIYSIFKHGVCASYPTLSILPVSTDSQYWNSPPTHLLQPELKKTMEYLQYTDNWITLPQVNPEPFDKMLLVACKGIDQVEALIFPVDLVCNEVLLES